MTPRLYIGTAGLSVWYSDDLGETLQRFWGASGMYSETRVWALSAHPERPGELLAGTDTGIYRLDIASGKWIHLPSIMDDCASGRLRARRTIPISILAGTRPPGIFRSTDGRETWERVEAPLPETCPAVMRPRVTQITFDPDDPDLVFAGLEIGGVWRSTDRGRTFQNASAGLVSEDIHGVAVVRNGSRLGLRHHQHGPACQPGRRAGRGRCSRSTQPRSTPAACAARGRQAASCCCATATARPARGDG
jgi:hypothetical protein